MPDVLPDPHSDFGARVRARLRDAKVLWLTTTSSDGTPQPNPVWFLWDGAGSMLVYNDVNAKRLEHVAVRPRLSAHFDGDGAGGDIIVFSAVAEQALDAPSPQFHEEYLAKYAADIDRMGSDPEKFAERYSVPLRIVITKVRGF